MSTGDDPRIGPAPAVSFEGSSTTHDAYPAHPVQPRQRGTKEWPYTPNTARLDGSTTTADAYSPPTAATDLSPAGVKKAAAEAAPPEPWAAEPWATTSQVQRLCNQWGCTLWHI